MRLVLIELITAGGIELEASPLRATVDYSELNLPLQHDTYFIHHSSRFRGTSVLPHIFIGVAKLSAQAVIVCVILAILF